MATSPAADRVHLRVDLEHALMAPNGRSPTTLPKTWFYEVPKSRADAASFEELIHRFFYDSNVFLRSREPTDAAHLMLVSFKTSPVDLKAVLAWDGKSVDPFPWHAAQKKKVWEAAVCFFVDDQGRYDALEPTDYTELLLQRALAAGSVTEAGFVKFFDRYFPTPPDGKGIFADRAQRLANLAMVRPSRAYRKPPGTQPFVSGPIDPALLG